MTGNNVLCNVKFFQLDDLELEEGEIVEEGEETQRIEVKDDSEREKLIREGKMTPFGTTATASKTVSFPRPNKSYTEEHVAVENKKTALKSKAEMISCGEMTPFGTIMETVDTSSRSQNTYFFILCAYLEVFLIIYHNKFFVDTHTFL